MPHHYADRRRGMMGPLLLGAGLGMLSANTRRPYAYGPPNIGAGLASGLNTGLQLYSALGKPTAAPTTRILPLGGGKEQMQEWDGAEWKNVGKPRDRFQPRAPQRPRYVTVREGTEQVTYQIDPDTLKRTEIGRGEAFKPDTGDAAETFSPMFPGVDPKRPIEVQARSFLLAMDDKARRQEPFTEREANLIVSARNIISRERMTLDRETGQMIAVRPEIAPWIQQLNAGGSPAPAPTPAPAPAATPTAPAPAVAPAPVVSAPAPAPAVAPAPQTTPRIRRIDIGDSKRWREIKGPIANAKKLIREIGKDLETGGTQDIPLIPGTGTTGIEGFARRHGGGLARQFGFDVPTTAEEIATKYRTLALELTPILTKESSRFSDQDAARVAAIIGKLENPLTDEQSIRSALVELVDVIEMIQQSYGE